MNGTMGMPACRYGSDKPQTNGTKGVPACKYGSDKPQTNGTKGVPACKYSSDKLRWTVPRACLRVSTVVA